MTLSEKVKLSPTAAGLVSNKIDPTAPAVFKLVEAVKIVNPEFVKESASLSPVKVMEFLLGNPVFVAAATSGSGTSAVGLKKLNM